MGIVDVEALIAFTRGLEGHIWAIDVPSGERWGPSDRPGIPLAAGYGMVIGWWPSAEHRHALDITAFGAAEGSLSTRWHTVIPLPHWVDVLSQEGDAFTVEGEVTDELLLVHWVARARYEGGAPPTDEILDESTLDERRILGLDLATGELVHDNQLPLEREKHANPPVLLDDRRLRSYRVIRGWGRGPWRAGERQPYLMERRELGGIWLAFDEPESSVDAHEIELTSDAAAEAAVTPDGRFVFLGHPEHDEPTWQVHSAESGEILWKLPFEPGTREVATLDDYVLYAVTVEEEGVLRSWLRCRSLSSHEPLWSLQLREEVVEPPEPPPEANW